MTNLPAVLSVAPFSRQSSLCCWIALLKGICFCSVVKGKHILIDAKTNELIYRNAKKVGKNGEKNIDTTKSADRTKAERGFKTVLKLVEL